MRAETLILGIGNILLKDEGVGVRVVEAMRPLALPDHVELLDGGTLGAGLLDEIADRRKVIVIDAARTGSPPGSVCRFSSDDLEAEVGTSLSLHEFGLLDTLTMARHLGCHPHEVVLFGVEPKEIALGLDLSDVVAAAIPALVRMVADEAAAGHAETSAALYP